jgi:GDPmannose 4,6-dehydratase
LFNHESPLRHERFVTKEDCRLGLPHRSRQPRKTESRKHCHPAGLGLGPECVEAMWLMLQTNDPDDYVIATGVSRCLEFINLHSRVWA